MRSFTLTGVAISVIGTLNFNDYCVPEARILSNAEKLNSAIRYLLKSYPPPVVAREVEPNVRQTLRPDRPIFYKDLDEFHAVNPNCCSIVRKRPVEEGFEIQFMERVTGTVTSLAEMQYQVRYTTASGQTESKPQAIVVPLSVCGRPARRWLPGDYFFHFHPSNFFRDLP